MSVARNRLAAITQTFLAPVVAYDQLYAAAQALYDLYCSILPPAGSNDMLLPSGKAIASNSAARCIHDIMRTKCFLRGLWLAILEAQTKFPDQVIEVLYAGTGPYAPLCLPLTTVFRPDEIQFTLLEVNPDSFQLLAPVVNALDARPYIRDLILADASQYQASGIVHIAVVEAMQAALSSEPQVAITRNLAPQIMPQGLLIPQQITVSAFMVNPSKSLEIRLGADLPYDDFHCDLGPLFQLDRHTAFPEALRPVAVTVPLQVLSDGLHQLNLFTNIHVFGDEFLRPWESALTMPVPLPVSRSGSMTFQYRIGNQPGFEWF
jgi:hypothetical protein